MGMFGSALKKIATPENLYLLGATLKDIGDGGSENFLGAQQMFQGRRDKAEATAKEDAQRQALADLVSGINGQPGVGNNIVGAGHGSVANPGEYGGIGPGMDGAPMGGRQPGLFGGQRAGMSMQALAPQFLQYAQKNFNAKNQSVMPPWSKLSARKQITSTRYKHFKQLAGQLQLC